MATPGVRRTHWHNLAFFTITGLVLSMAVALATAFSHSPAVLAASCDKVNIVYCGLDGSADKGYINSFQSWYNQGNNNGYSDLKAVYRWAGATDSSVKNMDTGNTKVGTMMRNGNIKVSGDVVGTDAWVSARFTEGKGYTKITDHAWARKTTTSLAEDSAPVIVHFDGNGNADWAVMVDCGNAVKFTTKPQPKPTPQPPKPQPKPQPALSCTSLGGKSDATGLSFNFTAKASASNTTITKYVFDFGDGSSQTVNSSAASAAAAHSYTRTGKLASYTATVKVFSSDFSGGATSSACAFKLSIQPTPTQTPTLLCTNLVGQADSTGLGYTFTVNASSTNTTITKYVFDFGDGNSQTVTSSDNSAQTTHTYNGGNSTYTARATVYSADFASGATSPDCTANIAPVSPPPATETPSASCVRVTAGITSSDQNMYTITALGNMSNGVTLDSADFTFGDGQNLNGVAPNTGANNVVVTHSYATAGTYSIVAILHFSSGSDAISPNPSCMTAISIGQPAFVCTPGGTAPTDRLCTPCPYNAAVPLSDASCVKPAGALVNTGAGSVIAIFAATVIGGFFISRRTIQRVSWAGAEDDILAEGFTEPVDDLTPDHQMPVDQDFVAGNFGRSRRLLPNVHRSRRYRR